MTFYMLQSVASERKYQSSMPYIWEYPVGGAISQAARSSLQVLCWMCSFSSSWDDDYSVFRFTKVWFTRISKDIFFIMSKCSFVFWVWVLSV